MPKHSAGILLYRFRKGNLEVLLVHPGGPFWAKRDRAAWSIPKGEHEEGEDPLEAAKRELVEETGVRVDSPLIHLGELRQAGGKIVRAWAAGQDSDPSRIRSNTFKMVWPPNSGRLQEFPEIDRAAWYSTAVAKSKLHKGQAAFIDKLIELLGLPHNKTDQNPTEGRAMNKIKIDNVAAFLYPMPMVLVGSVVEGKANFMAAAWVSRVNFKPPLMLIALGPHHTNKGIEEKRTFSINVPDVSLIEKTDYCGLVSGGKTDKSELFEVFYGELAGAPLIRECPVSMACSLYDTVKLPFDVLYIGEPKEVFTEEKYMTDNQLDIKKINPFTLSMPDNHYWSVGENLGKAWSIGKTLKKKG